MGEVPPCRRKRSSSRRRRVARRRPRLTAQKRMAPSAVPSGVALSVAMGLTCAYMLRRRRFARVRRAAVEVANGRRCVVARLLVADVDTSSRRTVRNVRSREVRFRSRSAVAVARSLLAEAKDLGATEEVAYAKEEKHGLRTLSFRDQLRALYRSATSANADTAAVAVGWFFDDGAWRLAAVASTSRRRRRADDDDHHSGDDLVTFVFSTEADDVPAWLRLRARDVLVVADDDALAAALSACCASRSRRWGPVRHRVVSTADLDHGNPQLALLREFGDACGVDEFAYAPTFGHCAGALVSNDLFYAHTALRWWTAVPSSLAGLLVFR
mmetsp:Transcript_4739/g.14820  ORF Transcript_4739/g.14820 Transcript_4739/m.14820 type:complete len:327 (+) Transcript_4739:2-982(+)